MTLTEQLAAERRERAHAANEPLRREADPDLRRTDVERARLAESAAAHVAAEQALNAAGMEQLAANKAVNKLGGADWASTFWRDLQSSKVTDAARAALQRAYTAKDAMEDARARLDLATKAHRAAVQEIDAATAARRRQAKRASGAMR